MNMRQLRYVLTLAREGSFSKAAETLNISQPSLSQYIKKIEKEWGLSLFDRTGGDIRITDAGLAYIEVGRKILDLEQQLERKFEDLSQFRSGRIVVGVSPHRCVHLLPEIVRRFRTLYPGMHLVIEERAGDSLLDGAEHGEFDLCIANLPVDSQLLTYHLMMKEELLLAVNTQSELYRKLSGSACKADGRKHPAVDIQDLEGAALVMLSAQQQTQKRLDEICARTGVNVTCAVECRTIETQFAMVRAGIGAALVPSGISAFSTAEQVAFFSFVQEIPYRDMAVIYRKGQYLSKAIGDLMEVMLHLGD